MILKVICIICSMLPGIVWPLISMSIWAVSNNSMIGRIMVHYTIKKKWDLINKLRRAA